MTISRKELGDTAEWLTVQYLEANGYRIVERNFRLRIGEIDIIADNGEHLCFIEVKAAFSDEFGTPFERVHSKKQRKIVKVAQAFLQANPHFIEERDIRFDVAAVFPRDIKDPASWKLDYLADAFRPF